MTPYQSSLNFVTIKSSPRGLMLVQPHNAQRLRDTLAKLKPRKFVKFESVKTGMQRTYPRFDPGMSTACYVQIYVETTHNLHAHLLPLAHACPNFEEPAPMLDPREPEVTQETINDDDNNNNNGGAW